MDAQWFGLYRKQNQNLRLWNWPEATAHPVYSPQSNGTAENYVTSMKRDDASFIPSLTPRSSTITKRTPQRIKYSSPREYKPKINLSTKQ
ncbi:hypothetical protein BZM26_35490 [Paraburkholderia strydomiana]|nr:hypothetical protein BZM26_35490 [Paraburkholderia strydomiana]